MQGLMMDYPLTLTHFFERSRRLFPKKRLATRVPGAPLFRYTYADFAERVTRLAGALEALGVVRGDRVGTLAWNSHRHLELYWAAPLSGAVLHTVNIRLSPRDLTYIINHAGDAILFVDASLWPVIEPIRKDLRTVRQYVVMPDAELESAVDGVLSSAFHAAGQRCLANSVCVAVGDAYEPLKRRLAEKGEAMVVGEGSDPDTEVGPVISGSALERILEWIDKGVAEGGELVLDGRGKGSDDGNFLGPTIIEADAEAEIAKEEIFGPVLTFIRARDLDHALEIMNASPKGNAASIFTTSGGAMRKFRYEAQAGMIGVNIGVAAPMSFFPFTGWKDSFFGDLHAHGRDAIEFYTEKKVVITRWPE